MRRLICALSLAMLLAPLGTAAQRPEKVYRIGWLSLSPPPAGTNPDLEAFQQGLRELGVLEGQNVLVEYRWAAGRQDRLPDLAAELVRLRVNAIVVGAGGEITAAMRATKEIPIIMVGAGDAVRSGFVASLARPGGNVTGLSVLIPELHVKLLELLREAAPGISRVAVLYNPAYPAAKLAVEEMRVAAKGWGVTVQPLEVREPNEFDSAFAAITREHAQALIAIDPFVRVLHQRRVLDFASKNRLPAVSSSKEFALAGGLLTYGSHRPDMYRRAATYVDKILNGAKPADLPVEQPTRFELVINLKTAKALGLTIPQSVLVRADEVIR